MFIGTFTQKIDKKGRFTIPKDLFLGSVPEDFLYMKNNDNSYILYDKNSVSNMVEGGAILNEDCKKFKRLQKEDNANRVAIKDVSNKYSKCEIKGEFNRIVVCFES